MNEFELILCRVLSDFEIDFRKFMVDKDERIKAHKYCYLVSKFYKFPIDGCFSLYINGPYNHHLTDVLFDIARNYDDMHCSSQKIELSKIHGLNNLIARIIELFPPKDSDVVSRLEIFTTFDFICTNYPSMSDNEKFDMLRRIKGHLFNSETTLQNLMHIREALNSR